MTGEGLGRARAGVPAREPGRAGRAAAGFALSTAEFAAERAATGYGTWVNPDILTAVPPVAKRVLDVGCGTGATGAALKRRQEAQVYGLERNETQADKARTVLDGVLCGDVERLALPFPPGFFDCILYGDILEHLVWPGDVLRKHLPLLSPTGIMVATVPNAQYVGVISKLVLGTWRYSDCGVLDSTHLRFFTRRSAVGLFAAAGIRITSVRRCYGPRAGLRAIDRVTLGLLGNFLSYKYALVGKPGPAGAERMRPDLAGGGSRDGR
jgi:SAM-dependent methyltransferase